LAIPSLGLFIIGWTIWRCGLRRPKPPTASIELPCGFAACFLLMAANSALIFGDRVVFASSVRGGPLAPFAWISPGVMAFYLFVSGSFSGAACVLGFQRRLARQQSAAD
jgi:hypothetical protein